MSEKFENLLNLALETEEAQRLETSDLNIGYSTLTNSWELIVKYHGSLEELRALGIVVEELIAGYAILTVPQDLIPYIETNPAIEYVEKPKQYYYAQIGPAETSCIMGATLREPYLSGEGVLLAVLDSGIDYRNRAFRNRDGSTRIRYLWDQSINADEDTEYKPPNGFAIGAEFSAEQINAALNEQNATESFALLPSRDVTGHGTAVAGIAAGYVPGEYRGVAVEAELLIVKLGIPSGGGFPRTTEIMRAVTYALQKAQEENKPLVMNLSFGNTYGAHDGSSLLERFLDNASEIGRTVIVVGAGNEGNDNGHVYGDVREHNHIELAIGGYESTLSLQIWKNFADIYWIRLVSPDGRETELIPEVERGKYTVQLGTTKLLIYFGQPTPYSLNEEIYIEFLPEGAYLETGVWSITFEPERIVTGKYYMYLPAGVIRNTNTGFYRPSVSATLTIPSTAQKVITVGAYDSTYQTYADFSGRGSLEPQTVLSTIEKPNISAPGVNIRAPGLANDYIAATGTSFATPIVAGAAALIMEWGIVMGNDPFLYGEKVKAYLQKGAESIRGEDMYPNEKIGWGALCVQNAIP